jgi:hypothetical protein
MGCSIGHWLAYLHFRVLFQGCQKSWINKPNVWQSSLFFIVFAVCFHCSFKAANDGLLNLANFYSCFLATPSSLTSRCVCWSCLLLTSWPSIHISWTHWWNHGQSKAKTRDYSMLDLVRATSWSCKNISGVVNRNDWNFYFYFQCTKNCN